MTDRIEALTKMIATCSPKMKPLYQKQLDLELAQLKDARVEEERRRLVILEAIKKDDGKALDAFAELEFGGDYRVYTPDEGKTWICESDVARFHQEDRHEFDTFARARSKRRELMHWRLYSKYVRTGDVKSLAELT